jgi:hypothetical protein
VLLEVVVEIGTVVVEVEIVIVETEAWVVELMGSRAASTQ